MEQLTAMIKAEIKNKYKSVRQFSSVSGIPQSTIISGLKKGVGGMSFDTVSKMCSLLDIKLSLNTSLCLDKEKNELLEVFSKLDERGRNTVKSACVMELLRCRNISVLSIAAALEKKQNSNQGSES